MKRIVLGVLAGVVMATPAVAAKQKVITVSSWGGPTHGINTIVWPTWKQWIEEATDNRVTLSVVQDMGPPPAQMDLVADGVADVTWFFHGVVPGRFELTKLPEFPTFRDFSSEAASAAYWRTHQKYLAQANEHRGVTVMGAGVHGPGQIFMRQPAARLADLNGKRLRTGGGVMTDLGNKLGLIGVLLPSTGVYEAGSTGVIDGAMLTLETLRSMRVGDALTHTLQVPGGFYRGSFTIFMNEATWRGLPEADRRAIESVSGEKLSRLFGYMMDQADERGVEYAKSRGNSFTQLPDEDIARLKELSAELPEQWAQKVSGRIDDPLAALAYYQEQLEATSALPSIAPETIEVRP